MKKLALILAIMFVVPVAVLFSGCGTVSADGFKFWEQDNECTRKHLNGHTCAPCDKAHLDGHVCPPCALEHVTVPPAVETVTTTVTAGTEHVVDYLPGMVIDLTTIFATVLQDPGAYVNDGGLGESVKFWVTTESGEFFAMTWFQYSFWEENHQVWDENAGGWVWDEELGGEVWVDGIGDWVFETVEVHSIIHGFMNDATWRDFACSWENYFGEIRYENNELRYYMDTDPDVKFYAVIARNITSLVIIAEAFDVSVTHGVVV